MKVRLSFVPVLLLLIVLLGSNFVLMPSASAADSASWPMFHGDPAHTGYTTANGPLTNHTLWTYQTGGEVFSSPCVVNGVVYIGSNDNNVYALDASTGAKLWNYTTSDSVESSPCVVNGVVYVGSHDNNVYALNALTGTKLWNYTTGGWVISSPCVVNGIVYVSSDDSNVYALDASTGVKLWSHTAGWFGEESSPCVANGVVYVGTDNFYVYALDASTGANLWTYDIAGYADNAPCVANGIVYVGSSSGIVGDGKVTALNASSGVHLWSYPTGDWVGSCPCVVNDIVYVGSDDNNVYALDAYTGTNLWNYTTGGWVRSSPCFANGILYVGSWDWNVYALDAYTGAKLWSYTTGQQIQSSPCVVNGVAYVGSHDNKVYAFCDTFIENSYTITLNTIGSGSISRNASEPYIYGQAVNLTASPALGWSFSGWSEDVSGNVNPATIIMDANKTVTATFVQNTYVLTVNIVGDGSVQRNATEPYLYGQAVNLTAIADAGWTFQAWSGDLTGTTNPTTIIMDSNKTVTATFIQNTYTITINTIGQGTVARNATEPYSYGQAVNLTANAASGWTFQGWSGDLMGKTNSATLIMDANKTVTANFAQNQTGYTIEFTQTGLPNGTAWSVKFNQTRITSTQPTITFTNIPNGTYSWCIQTPIPGTTGVRYVTRAAWGTMAVPLQTSKNVTFTTQYQLTINVTGLAPNHHTNIYLSKIIQGTASNTIPFTKWFNAGTQTGTIGASAIITHASTKSKFTSWNNTITTNPRASIIMNSPVTLTANYTTQVKVAFKVTGVPSFFKGSVVNIDGVNYTRPQLPSTFWWTLGSNHTFQYYSQLSLNCKTQCVWTSTNGLSTQQAATINLTKAGIITANYHFRIR